MARVVSVFLPTLPTNRIRRAHPSLSPDTPLVVIARSGSKRWLAAAHRAALKVDLRVGMPAAKAQALVQGLTMINADLAADRDTCTAVALGLVAIFAHAVPPFTNATVMHIEPNE
jgi:protein ImuB